MSRLLPVVLAVCCVLSMGVAAAPSVGSSAAADGAAPSQTGAAPSQSGACGNDSAVVCVNGSANHLSLNGDIVVASANDTSIDVSSAVASDVAEMNGRLSTDAFANAYRAAPPEARQDVVERYGDALENRTAALRARERATLRAYNDGRVSGDEFLRTLAEIDAEADRLWVLSREVSGQWQSATGEYNRDPYASVRADLYGLRGPIRDDLQSVYAGADDTMRVHVTTTDSGFALAAFVEHNGQRAFLRDTYLGDVRRLSAGDDRYDGNPSRAYQRITDLYPWAFSYDSEDIGGASGTYRATGVHIHGETTVYLDGASGRVFAENQRQYLERIPTERASATNESSGLTVALETTYQGGPLNVTVTDESGERVDADVTIGGRSVGATGEDGTLWTVAPYSSIVTVRVEHDGETVRIQQFPY